jgi:hypothetical protein
MFGVNVVLYLVTVDGAWISKWIYCTQLLEFQVTIMLYKLL